MPSASRQVGSAVAGWSLQSILGGSSDMSETTPTFGRYTEIPYDEVTPEQQEGYRFLVETRGAAGGPSTIWVHNPKLVKASAPISTQAATRSPSASARSPSSSSTANGIRPARPTRMR